MYQALYRKYRPNNFENVVGQKSIIQTLKNSILNNKISHAYLFTGPRGTGKTSVAKILAQLVNCENLQDLSPCNKCVSCTQILNKQNTDIIEIDAASNNGVDEIRDLRDKVSLVPSYGKYKVYIIDEVHMLTTSAFNALLKTLEEPPKHIIFILATTEPHKIPQTILSRCQRYDFKKISTKDIINRIKFISKEEKIEIEESAIELIAALSDGGMRDSLSLLDQVNAYTNGIITPKEVNEVCGTITIKQIYEMMSSILNCDIKNSFNLIDCYDDSGKNLVKIIEQMIDFCKNALIYNSCSDYFKQDEEKNFYSKILDITIEEKIYTIIEILLDAIKTSKETSNIKLVMQLAIIKIIKKDNKKEVEPEIIIESPRKIESQTKIEMPQLNDEIKNKIEKLKKIRINNTLANFDKKDSMEFKKKIDSIKELLMDPEYSSIVSLILDGELKAKGKNYLIFVYNITNLNDCFNQSLIKIEEILEKMFKEKLKPIALSNEEWDPIKKEFNKNMKLNINPYQYEEETLDLKKYLIINEQNKNIKQTNEIESLFDDIIEYS